MVETDKKTLELIKEVNKQKQELNDLKKKDKSKFITNCCFFLEGSTISNNLHILSLEKLIYIAACLIDKKEKYVKAAELLGVQDVPPLLWDGFSIDDWLDDIKTQIAKNEIVTKTRKLETLEKRLGAIISSDLKAQLELEEIEKALK